MSIDNLGLQLVITTPPQPLSRLVVSALVVLALDVSALVTVGHIKMGPVSVVWENSQCFDCGLHGGGRGL